MAQKFLPHFSTCRKSCRRWDRTWEGEKGQAEATEATPRQMNGCALIRPWEVKLMKAPMPHLRSHTRPSPCNLPRWDRPPVNRRPALLRKLPSRLACPLNPSQSLGSAGISKEKPPPATTSSSKTEGSSPTWGSKSCPIAPQVCEPNQLCSHPCFRHP